MDAPISHHSSNHSLLKSEIKAVLSVPPMKVTESRQIRRVSITQKKITTITKGWYQTVLYYQKVNEEEENGGWFLAGWIRESLGRALLEEPILCGRVQKKEEEHDFLEIVSNDSGMRLYEAIFPMNLSEFLELSDEKKENLEGELVFWKEIDEQSPQYSPLFYVQVTKFECGGYSIGISISLLLADIIIIIENFLKKWSQIHNNLLPQIQNEVNKTPIFYHPLLINEPPISSLITPTPIKNGSPNTALFKITSKELIFTMELWKELALLCVEKAEQLIMDNTKKVILGSDFSLIVKDSYGVIKIEGFSKRVSGNIDEKILGLKGQIVSANWSYFGDFDDVAFQEGNKPKFVSNWIGSVSDGIVMAFPCQKENVSALVIVSLPQ